MNSKPFFITLLLMCMVFVASAQPGGEDRKERMKALKIGFLTEQLSLTSDEAKTFWPLYDEYEAKMEAMRKEAKLERAEARINWDEMSDADASKMLDEMFARRAEELELQQQFSKDLEGILPAKKVARFWRAEAHFRMKVLEEIQRRQQGQGQGRGGRGGRGGRPMRGPNQGGGIPPR